IALLSAIALYLGVGRLRRRLRRYLSSSSRASASWTRFLELLCQPGLFCLQWGIWIGLGLYLTALFPASRQWRYELFSFFDVSFREPIFILGKEGFSVLDVLKLLLLVIGLWIGVRGMTQLIKSRLLQTVYINPGTQDAIAILLQSILTGLGLIIILEALGIDLSSIAILASVLGVGIGFGLQNIANNFISGLIILFERPIQVGDFINLGDLTGTVERIGSRSTEIRTLDQVTIIVPNSEFIESKVINWSHGYPVSRLHIPFGVAYNSPIQRVRQAALDAAKAHPQVLRYPQPQLWLQGFGDSSLNFDLLIWIREPRHQFQLKSDLYYLLEAIFRRYQLEIPFPQRDIHLRSP
ncbi:MAG: mechanosensitive ion channel family protein, partial [Microcystaceae cyanobacterium]